VTPIKQPASCGESHVIGCNQRFPDYGEPSLMEGMLLNSDLPRSEKRKKYFQQDIELS